MEQGRLWDEPAPVEAPRRPGRRRSTPRAVEAATLPLWAEPPGEVAEAPPDAEPAPRATEAAPTAAPVPPARVQPAPAPAPRSETPARRPSPLRPPPAAPASRARPQPAAAEPDMESIADSLEELLEAGGAPARAVRPFLAACPPTSRWKQPEGFVPRPGSYAQAVRDVLAGRRRVRIVGQDDMEVTASKDGAGEWSVSP